MKVRRIYFYYLVIIPILTLFSCGPKNLQRDYFPVDEVISGSQIKLRNGYIVNLLGIESTLEGGNYLRDNILNRKVRLVFDTKCPIYKLSNSGKTKEIFAYLMDEKKNCINSLLLNQGIAEINVNPYLSDSLENYVAFASKFEKIKENNEEEQAIADFKNYIYDLFTNISTACDYINPVTRDYAVTLAGQHSGNFSTNQIIDIFDAIRPPHWNYVSDPRGREFFSSASNTISKTNLSGDCDDFAILMYSLITSIGGQARISFAKNKYMGHAFTEVNIRDIRPEDFFQSMFSRFSEFSIDSLHYKKEADNVWLNLDWWGAYPGGKYMDYDWRIIIYPVDSLYDVETVR